MGIMWVQAADHRMPRNRPRGASERAEVGQRAWSVSLTRRYIGQTNCESSFYLKKASRLCL